MNIGRISNHGFELGINANAVSRRSFTWDIGTSVSTTTDHIDDMGGLPFIIAGGLPFHRNEQGFPIGALFTKIVRSATYDPATKKVSGVRFVDAKTGQAETVTARLVFLCASALASSGCMG